MDVERRGQLSAWLLKKKSGSAMVRVRQYNKRFFTIDFNSKVVFYAHQENSKKVSSIIAFADIQDVRMGDSKNSDQMSETSARPSLLSRGLSFTKSSASGTSEKEQHLITVVVRSSKSIELLCASATEATEWCDAFRSAIAMGGGAGIESNDVAGSCDNSLPTVAGSAEASANAPAVAPAVSAAAASPAPSPREETTRSAAAVSHQEPQPTPSVQTASSAIPAAGGEAASDNGPADDASAPAKPATGTFLDFGSMEQDEPSGATASRAAGSATELAVIENSPQKMQATDFGFAADEDSASSCAGSDGGGIAEVDGNDAGGGSEDAKDSAREGKPGGKGSPMRGGYASATLPLASEQKPSAAIDRHEGLSMKERLANLEFSDCEDDDDDPLGLGKST